jgi:hypothetical protein
MTKRQNRMTHQWLGLLLASARRWNAISTISTSTSPDLQNKLAICSWRGVFVVPPDQQEIALP